MGMETQAETYRCSSDGKRYTERQIVSFTAKAMNREQRTDDECRALLVEHFGMVGAYSEAAEQLVERIIAASRAAATAAAASPTIPPKSPQTPPDASVPAGQPKTSPDVSDAAVMPSNASRVSADLAAALDAFDKNNGNIPPEQSNAVERYFKMRLSDADLRRLNQSIAAAGKRQLSYSDFANIYIIHRRNIAKNDGGQAPQTGVEKWSEKAADSGIIDGPYCRIHFRVAMTLFSTLNVVQKMTEANWKKGKAATYRLVPCSELDPHF